MNFFLDNEIQKNKELIDCFFSSFHKNLKQILISLLKVFYSLKINNMLAIIDDDLQNSIKNYLKLCL